MARRVKELFEDGGETITVVVMVNGIQKFRRSATITGDDNKPNRRYTLDDGTEITHNRNSGFLNLAKKLIK